MKSISSYLSFSFMTILAVFVLSSCVPTTSSTEEKPVVAVEEINRPLSFYPQETGATWHYLPNGASIDANKSIERVEGPRVVSGKRFIVSKILGRGLDITTYKEYQPDGVYFSREEGPGYILNLNPPIREYPSEAEMRVGMSWRGSSQAELIFTDAGTQNPVINFQTDYVYTVVDKRPVRLDIGEFEVYVIDLESRRIAENQAVEVLNQVIWFTPYIGVVRNEFDQVLVGGSFMK